MGIIIYKPCNIIRMSLCSCFHYNNNISNYQWCPLQFQLKVQSWEIQMPQSHLHSPWQHGTLAKACCKRIRWLQECSLLPWLRLPSGSLLHRFGIDTVEPEILHDKMRIAYNTCWRNKGITILYFNFNSKVEFSDSIFHVPLHTSTLHFHLGIITMFGI